MKFLKVLCVTIFSCICLFACNKDNYDFLNLRRDNPLDEKNNMQDGIVIKFNDYTIDYEDNHDRIINTGETVYIVVNLKNSGEKNACEVKASFSTISSYISFISLPVSIYYGDISANSKKYSYLKFTVANDIPINTKITFDITIEDAASHSWKDNFNIIVDPL